MRAAARARRPPRLRARAGAVPARVPGRGDVPALPVLPRGRAAQRYNVCRDCDLRFLGGVIDSWNAERVYMVPARVLRARCAAVMAADSVALYAEADVRRLAASVLVPDGATAEKAAERLRVNALLAPRYRASWARCIEKAKRHPELSYRRTIELSRRCVERVEAQDEWLRSIQAAALARVEEE